MKKTIASTLLFFAALASAFSLCGCQQLQTLSKDPNFQQLAATVITKALTGNVQGTTYNYSGTLTSVLLKKGADGQYAFVNGKGTTASLTATCPLIVNQAGGNITLPALTVDGGQMADVAFGNLTIGTTTGGNTLAVSENTTGAGTFTIDGKTLNLSSVFVECTYNTTSTMKYSMSIYFGDNLDYAVNLTFDGKIAQ